MGQQKGEGRSVAKKRRALGLTQHQLSHSTGIGLNRLIFFETGRCALLPEEVDRIRKVFKQRASRVMDLVSA